MMKYKFNATYNEDLDKINFLYLTIPTFLLSIFIHPSLNDNFYLDVIY